jgi:hypothetical protein
MAFHGFPREFQGCLAITALCDKAFQDLPFVIHSPPTVVHLATPIAHTLPASTDFALTVPN